MEGSPREERYEETTAFNRTRSVNGWRRSGRNDRCIDDNFLTVLRNSIQGFADDKGVDVPDNLFLGREKTLFNLGPFSILDYKKMREATLAGLEKTGVKIPSIHNTIQNMSGGQRQCVAIARTAAFHSKLAIMDEPTAALGVQETAQAENIIRALKEAGEPLILISHNMRQVFDLADRIIVFWRGRITTARGVVINTEIFVNCRYGYDIQCQVVGEEGAAYLPEPMAVTMRKGIKLQNSILTDWKDRFVAAFDTEPQSFIDGAGAGTVSGPFSWDGYMVAITSDACVGAQENEGAAMLITNSDRPSLYN